MDNFENDRIILDRFYETISWKNECEEIEFNERILLKTPCSLDLVANSNVGIISNTIDSVYCLRQLFPNSGLEPGLIIWGNPPDFVVHEYISFCCQWNPPVHVQFIDIPARLAYSRFLTKALDGIDWQRSIEGLAKGNKNPVWIWDK